MIYNLINLNKIELKMLNTIYELSSENTSDVYIGKTIQKLGTRKSEHTSKYKKWIKGHVEASGRETNYCGSFEIVQYNDFEIIEIESNVEEKDVINRERYWIENTANTTNITLPGRTDKERYCDNHNGMKDKSKQYYNANQNEIIIKKKIYRAKNPKHVSELRKKLQHCSNCSKLIAQSQMRQHQGIGKYRTDKKCKAAQKARQIIF